MPITAQDYPALAEDCNKIFTEEALKFGATQAEIDLALKQCSWFATTDEANYDLYDQIEARVRAEAKKQFEHL